LPSGPSRRTVMPMHQIQVSVASPEEASHGVAEFWAGGELFAFTRLEDDDLLLHVVPRRDGTTVVVAARHLGEALEQARALLARA
jgi:hypothetical protein